MALTVKFLQEGDFAATTTGNTYQYLYRVFSDTPDPGRKNVAIAVCNYIAPGTTIGTPHWSDPNALLMNADVQADQEADDGSFVVTISYGQNQATDQQSYVDSTYQEIRTEFYSVLRPYVRDIDGRPATNAAGDLPADPRMRNSTVSRVSITKYESYFPDSMAHQFTNTLNSNTFRGNRPGTVLCAGILSEEIIDPSFILGRYWRVSYVFDVDVYYGWDDVYLNEGYRELKTINEGEEDEKTVLVDIIDDVTGDPITLPVMLDANGRRAPQGAEPIWITRRIYPRVPFIFPGVS